MKKKIFQRWLVLSNGTEDRHVSNTDDSASAVNELHVRTLTAALTPLFKQWYNFLMKLDMKIASSARNKKIQTNFSRFLIFPSMIGTVTL